MFSVLAFVGVIFAAIVVLALGILLLKALARLILVLFAAVAALFAAVGIGIAAGVVADNYEGIDGIATGLLVTALMFVPVVIFIWWRFGSLSQTPPSSISKVSVPIRDTAATKLASDRSLALQEAWQQAESLAPRQTTRLRRASQACDRLIARMSVGAGAFDSEWVDTRTLIERHIPALVVDTRSACDGADADKAKLLKNRLADQLEAIGHRAWELLERERLSAEDALIVRGIRLEEHLQREVFSNGSERPRRFPLASRGWKRLVPWVRSSS